VSPVDASRVKRPSFFYSIRFRLVLWFTAILALVLTAFSLFVYYNEIRDIHGNALLQMENRMDLIIRSLPFGHVPSSLLGSEDVFLLLRQNGGVIASQGLESEQEGSEIAASAEGSSLESFTSREGPVTSWVAQRGSSATEYIYMARPVSIDGRPGIAILGSPYDPYGLYSRLGFTLLAGSLLTLAIALGGGLWLADRAMRPVQAITQTAREISETDLTRRLNLRSKNELGQLADTFDAMLDRLQAAFARQRQFVADASHELRTPLTIVSLEADRALAARRTPEEYEQAMRVIRGENELMTRLVGDLLTLARMDSGQQTLKHEPVDLSDVALDAAERLLALAGRSGVQLETGALPEAPTQGDGQLLLQMVSNLVENGIKYGGGSGHRVLIETGSQDGQSWVRVSDDGPGIPADDLPLVFNRFYRADKARTQGNAYSLAGSGLGLSIVQSIAHLHGGKIRVESAPGEGTTFEVRLPSDLSG
jgi:signal transduction histidine kinase